MSRPHTPEPIYPNDENPMESDSWPFRDSVTKDLFRCFIVALAISAIIISGFIRIVTL